MNQVDLLRSEVHVKQCLNFYYLVITQKQILKILQSSLDTWPAILPKYHTHINQLRCVRGYDK